MNYTRNGSTIMARLDRGDNIMESLTAIAEAEAIKAGSVSAIGAVDKAIISYFLIDEQRYDTQTFEEPFEVLSLNGTLTTVDEKPHQHVHIVLGRSDFSTIGGHLQEATVNITLEMHITILDETVTRSEDDTFDIQTLHFN